MKIQLFETVIIILCKTEINMVELWHKNIVQDTIVNKWSSGHFLCHNNLMEQWMWHYLWLHLFTLKLIKVAFKLIKVNFKLIKLNFKLIKVNFKLIKVNYIFSLIVHRMCIFLMNIPMRSNMWNWSARFHTDCVKIYTL